MKRLKTSILLLLLLFLVACQGVAPDTSGVEPRLEELVSEIERLAGVDFG